MLAEISVREDISKDVVNPDFRGRNGKNHIMTDCPEWMDLKPGFKFINKTVSQRGEEVTCDRKIQSLISVGTTV